MSDMTMRDQFAMAALTGILGNEDADLIASLKPDGARDLANHTYKLADAMMKARQAQGEGK